MTEVETHILEVVARQIGDLQQGIADVLGFAEDTAVNVAPNHHIDDFLFGGFRFVHCADMPAIPKDGNAVRDPQHFVQLVGYVNDGDVLRFERFDHLKEPFSLGLR